jgi:hypothetical protein
MQTIARRAVLSFHGSVICRSCAWAALQMYRLMGCRLISLSLPRCITANGHSGVTLAAAHANLFAPMVAEGALDCALELLSAKRFDVPAAA